MPPWTNAAFTEFRNAACSLPLSWQFGLRGHQRCILWQCLRQRCIFSQQLGCAKRQSLVTSRASALPSRMPPWTNADFTEFRNFVCSLTLSLQFCLWQRLRQRCSLLQQFGYAK